MATTINLSWPANPASEGILKYQVLESLNGGPFNLKADVLSGTSLQILNPAPGAYRWKVHAVNFVGTGPDSNIALGPDIPTQTGDIAVQVVNS